MDTLSAIFNTVLLVLEKFWTFKLYEVDGNRITLGVVLIGILMLFVGYVWSRRLSLQIADKVLARFDIDDSTRAAITQVIFYVLLIVFTLFVLHLLNVPVTIFTVMGGALAIGVGLGSQKVLNNFISGIILMVERPIKVGDVIEVSGLRGVVEEIGTRATKVKSINNTHIIVPNSSFLEQNVLNWTLSDNVVRHTVRVGVAYGSDTEKVRDLMLAVVKEHKMVLKFPEPSVFFNDFGDSSLIFDVFYFCQLSSFLDLHKIGSDLRFSIDARFRQEKVVIAFPQRDLHLHSSQPLPVVIQNK